ncbi:MAG TPA: M56 family metallopeptidase [Vicinamibacterales bacterium]|nr:M56 family metallopeptidase [Vicinamibacterales bacterium]
MTLEFIVRSSIILLAGLGGVRLQHRQPAAVRHWVLAAAVLLAAAQPVITAVMAPVIPAVNVQRTELIVIESPGAAESGVGVTTSVDRVGPLKPAAAIDWQSVAYRVWLGGVAMSSALLLIGVLWLRWLGSRGRQAGPAWQEAADAVRAQLGVTRPVRLIVTNHPALLVTWGVVSPVILLPDDADTWTADRIRHVVAHEVAHLRRRDWLIQFATEAIRAINWFNPLFWIACAQIRRDSEHACDDIVLDLGFRGTSYASHLLALARSFSVHGRTWLPAPSIARPSTLERRVRAMLNPQVDRRPISNQRRVAIAAVLLALTLPVAAATQTGVPSGTVADPMGRALADAVVRLVPADGGQPIDTRTDPNGHFQFPDVPAGDYMMSVRHPGFSSKRHRVTLKGGGVTFNLQVQVGTLRETITVTGGAGDTPATRQVQTAPSTAAHATPPTCAASDGGQIKPPMKIRDVRPRYKQEWVAAGLEGSILMQATVGKDGKVRGLDVVSPVNAELEDEALAAVSGWEFSPTYLNCEPIEVQMFVTVAFKKPV